MSGAFVDVGGMRSFQVAPETPGPCAGVLVCMHAPGVDGFMREMCRRLAAAGFAAIAPDLYHRQEASEDNPLEKMGKLLDLEVVADLAAASAHLRAIPEVDAARIGVIGFCMGGRLAWLQASHDEALRASVVFYGGNIMVAWGDVETPFARADRIACPMLGLFGGDDGNPSPQDVEKLDAELTRLGKAHEFHGYEGAGHAFLNEKRPSYREEAAANAWARCEAFLLEHLA